LVKVTVCTGLVVPTACALKASDGGEKVTGSAAIPEMGRICVFTAALSVKVTEPEMFPASVGVKLTATLQLAPAASVPPQGVLVVARAYWPLATTPVILTAVPLEFVTMTEWAGLVVLITVEGMLTVRTENVRGPADPPEPVPERLTTCGLKIPL
jgi:hypothetical protein